MCWNSPGSKRIIILSSDKKASSLQQHPRWWPQFFLSQSFRSRRWEQNKLYCIPQWKKVQEHTHAQALSLSLTHTLSQSHNLSHTQKHTRSLLQTHAKTPHFFLSLSHTHTHPFSLKQQTAYTFLLNTHTYALTLSCTPYFHILAHIF